MLVEEPLVVDYRDFPTLRPLPELPRVSGALRSHGQTVSRVPTVTWVAPRAVSRRGHFREGEREQSSGPEIGGIFYGTNPANPESQLDATIDIKVVTPQMSWTSFLEVGTGTETSPGASCRDKRFGDGLEEEDGKTRHRS